jgi:Zn-dependent protease
MEHLSAIQLFAVWSLPVLFAITVHEVAHGFTAHLLGDKTAFILGRLTLNPLKHIDPIGTILVPAVLLFLGGFVFGWARPVPVNPHNLHKPKRDMALVAISGPLSNILMAIIWAAIAKIGLILLAKDFPGALAINYMGQAGIIINLALMTLNLIPLPPLDGSHILSWILPKSLQFQFIRIAPFGFVILLVMLALGVLGKIISPVVVFFYDAIARLFGM